MGTKKFYRCIFTSVCLVFFLSGLVGCESENMKLSDVSLSQVMAHSSAAYYLGEDGTLYCPGADEDAGCFVVFQDEKKGIVAENVAMFCEISSGGCYLDMDNNLFMWAKEPLPVFGYTKGRVHSQIGKDIRYVAYQPQRMLLIDMQDDLYLIGQYAQTQYSMENPLHLASDVSFLAKSVANQDGIMWVSKDGNIEGLGVDNKHLLQQLQHRFSGIDVTDIQWAKDYIAILSGGQLWFYGDYEKLCTGQPSQTVDWVELDRGIAQISCAARTVGALDEKGNLKLWGRCIANDRVQTDEPHYSYLEKESVAENAQYIYISDGYVCYIDSMGKSNIFHAYGWNYYGNATKDKYVGINREPNTWL